MLSKKIKEAYSHLEKVAVLGLTADQLTAAKQDLRAAYGLALAMEKNAVEEAVKDG